MAQRMAAEPRPRPLPGGYGWYRFDAVSLDGRYVLVATWYSGFLFSPRYYDEVLDLQERGGVQPETEAELADPTNHGAFAFSLYGWGRTAAHVVVEAPLARGGSDPWFPALHAGEGGLGEMPLPGVALGVGENRVTRERDGSYRIEFSDRSRWTRSHIEGEMRIRPLGGGSPVIPLTPGGAASPGGATEWQILASRAEVVGRIAWTKPLSPRRRHLEFQGLGFIDRHAGRLPISPNFGRWLWGRFQGSERTIAYYRTDPAGSPVVNGGGATSDGRTAGEFLFSSDRSGGALIEGGTIRPKRIHRNRWGMPHPLTIEGSGGGRSWTANVVRIVDRGPFHVRCLSRLSCEDEVLDGLPGITECFLPARWDVPLYRVFAQTRIRKGP